MTEQTNPRSAAGLPEEPVTLPVPMLLASVDMELNVMAMLTYVMHDQGELLTDSERYRIAEWFASKFGQPA